MIPILLLLVFSPFAIADVVDYLFSAECGHSGNYPAKSTYQLNLKKLCAAFPTDASSTPTLFASGSVGAAADTVYGLVRCFGDVNTASDCRNCVVTAFQDAQQSCPFSMDVTIFRADCILNFSGQDFTFHLNSIWNSSMMLEATKKNLITLPGWDPNNPESVSITTDIIKILLQETARHAAYNTTMRYATGRMVVSSTATPLYSLAQCRPDMARTDCWDCLNALNNMTILSFVGQAGGRTINLWCNLRYETVQFYQGKPMRLIGSSSAPITNTTNTRKAYKRRVSNVLVISMVLPLLLSFFCLIFCLRHVLIRRHKKDKVRSGDMHTMNMQGNEALVWETEARSSEFTFFDFSCLSDATSNFSDENKLGQGGFGLVYKGCLPGGLEIAIKRLASHSSQGFTEFKNEVQLIAKLQHTNLVRLLGCCSQGEEKILVYEYLPNGSLDFFIFDETRRSLLNWSKRLTVIEGIAHGLLYLHKHSRLRVIHRDLKASNILLDHEMHPKISDFGLAKIFSSNDTEGSTRRVVGTYGYMAPEYASEGLFSVKSDVFSFGVLILEIISGKRNSGFRHHKEFFSLLGYAWKLWQDEGWVELIDESLVPEFDALEARRCVNTALLCVQEDAIDRPTMSDVVAMLSTESMTLPEPKFPAYFHISVTKEERSVAAEPSSINGVTMSVVFGR